MSGPLFKAPNGESFSQWYWPTPPHYNEKFFPNTGAPHQTPARNQSMMRGIRWTEKEKKIIIEHWKKGTLIKNISYMIDRTPSQINGIVHRLDLPRRRVGGDRAFHKVVTMPRPMHAAAVQRAASIGISFSAYIRNLIARDMGR